MMILSPTFSPTALVPDDPLFSRPLSWEALSFPYIEAAPKAVIQDDEFIVAIDLSERQRRDYAVIVGFGAI